MLKKNVGLCMSSTDMYNSTFHVSYLYYLFIAQHSRFPAVQVH